VGLAAGTVPAVVGTEAGGDCTTNGVTGFLPEG
jgi:hypothetical protein